MVLIVSTPLQVCSGSKARRRENWALACATVTCTMALGYRVGPSLVALAGMALTVVRRGQGALEGLLRKGIQALVAYLGP